MVILDLLGQQCPKCKKGLLKELSLSYTCRLECSHCKAIFDRMLFQGV
uniref:Uncharacterized protein n=1 Tax=Pseudomonas phage Pyxpy01 TaxID=3138546 RepID=A0AAU6VZE7_9VIRU